MEDQQSNKASGSNVEMHALVFGHVQGVCFRAVTLDYAEALGISGTVRNLRDGSVEIYAQGRIELLEELLAKLDQNYGTRHIESVHKVFAKPVQAFRGFKILYLDV